MAVRDPAAPAPRASTPRRRASTPPAPTREQGAQDLAEVVRGAIGRYLRDGITSAFNEAWPRTSVPDFTLWSRDSLVARLEWLRDDPSRSFDITDDALAAMPEDELRALLVDLEGKGPTSE